MGLGVNGPGWALLLNGPCPALHSALSHDQLDGLHGVYSGLSYHLTMAQCKECLQGPAELDLGYHNIAVIFQSYTVPPLHTKWACTHMHMYTCTHTPIPGSSYPPPPPFPPPAPLPSLPPLPPPLPFHPPPSPLPLSSSPWSKVMPSSYLEKRR